MTVTKLFRMTRLILTGALCTWVFVCLIHIVQDRLARDLYATPTKPYVSVNAPTHGQFVHGSVAMHWLQDALLQVIRFWEMGD